MPYWNISAIKLLKNHKSFFVEVQNIFDGANKELNDSWVSLDEPPLNICELLVHIYNHAEFAFFEGAPAPELKLSKI